MLLQFLLRHQQRLINQPVESRISLIFVCFGIYEERSEEIPRRSSGNYHYFRYLLTSPVSKVIPLLIINSR